MIKKNKTILIILLLLQLSSFGQSGFDKVYSFNPYPHYSVFSGIRSIFADTQSIIITGLTYKDSLIADPFSSRAAFLASVDYSGNVLWQKLLGFSLPHYQTTEPNLFHLLKKVRPGKYVLGAQGWDCTNLAPSCFPRPFLYFFNQNGDSLRFVPIPFGNLSEVNFLYSIMLDKQSNILATGSYMNNGYVHDTMGIWLSKFDSTGNFLWKRIINNNLNVGYTASGFKVINSHDGLHYFIGGEMRHTDTINNTWFSVWKTDTSGNVIWQKSIPKTNPFVFFLGLSEQYFDLIPSVTGDGYYFIAADVVPIATDSTEGRAIYYCGKLNEEGEVVWAKTYQRDSLHIERIFGLTQKPNGDLLFMGLTNGQVTPEAIESSGASLFCTDSIGNLKWFKVTKRYNCPYKIGQFTNTMALTPNGGIVRGGYIGQFNEQPGCYDTTHAIAWLVLADSLGRKNPQDTITYSVQVDSVIFPKIADSTSIVRIPQSSNAAFRVYPNPTKDKVSIELQSYLGSVNNMDISLYDYTGHMLWRRQIHQKQLTIDLSLYAAGFYYFRLRQDGIDLGGVKVVKQ